MPRRTSANTQKTFGAGPPQQKIRSWPPRTPVRAAPVWSLLLLAVTMGLTGCTKPEGVPASGGQVWEIDVAGRADSPAAVLAYVNGVHVIVVDGSNVYAGMTPLKTERRADGGSTIKLANGLEAQLLPAAEGRIELRFSTGESIAMRKKEVAQTAESK
jgi:hypothetical protein